MMTRRTILLLAGLALAAPGVASADPPPSSPAAVTVCFTPGEDCTGLIVGEIAGARRRVLVQAYSFTSRRIGEALAMAAARGIEVRVIVDDSELRGGDTQAPRLARIGVPVLVDAPPDGIAHGKVMIIDDREVITGSFNFTEAAQRRNAENVLILTAPTIAAAYTDNWRRRSDASRPYTPN